jgi:hypothetical protein
MRATAAASRWRAADLRNDEAKRTAAAAELATLGVKKPNRMCTLLVPTKKSGVEADEAAISQVQG